MQGWGIRQEIDDEKPYDEGLQCVRHGNLRTICDSVMGPSTGFSDESLAPTVILRALPDICGRYPRPALFLRNLSQFQLE